MKIDNSQESFTKFIGFDLEAANLRRFSWRLLEYGQRISTDKSVESTCPGIVAFSDSVLFFDLMDFVMSSDALAIEVSLPQSGLRSSIRFWPLALFFSIAMILNPLLWVMMDQAGSPYLQFVYFGLMFGELILVGMIGGLFGRHWLFGYATGLAIALVGLAVVWQITDFRISAFRQLPWFWRACHIPATLMLASLPLMTLRMARHWRIALSDGKGAMRLEDIFIFTSIVGCVIVLLITPTSVAGAFAKLASRYDNVLDPSNLIRDELRFAGWGALSLLLACPLAFILLDRNHRLASRWKFGLAHLVVVLAIGLAILVGLSRSIERLPHFSLAIVIAYFIVTLGLLSLRGSGFSLHGKYSQTLHDDCLAPETKQISNSNSSKLTKPVARSATTIWLPRLASVSIIVAAVYVTLVAGGFQRRAQQALHSFALVKDSFREKGGTIDGETHRTAATCTFSSEMGDSELAELESCYFLEQLDLSNSKVTDEGFSRIASLSQIRDFDFSNTSIGDATLENIAKVYGRLRSINLSNTKVTGTGICKFVKAVRSAQIYLGDNNLTDADLVDFEANPRTIVHLYGNPITDASLERLSAYRGLGLGRNRLSPNWPSIISNLPESLCLQGEDIDDATCEALGNKGSFFDRLLIDNTSITDAGICKLAKLDINTLEVGPGKITDQGLATAALKVSYQLKLSGHFTGTCLQTWNLPSLESIDLSDSQVTDEILESISIPKSLRRFGVSNTKVTDVGIKCVHGSQLDVVHVATTSISDQAITALPTRIALVEPTRFTTDLQTIAAQRGVSLAPVVPPTRILDDARQDNRASILAAARQQPSE